MVDERTHKEIDCYCFREKDDYPTIEEVNIQAEKLKAKHGEDILILLEVDLFYDGGDIMLTAYKERSDDDRR